MSETIYLYSTEDFYEAWDRLMMYADQKATQEGTTFVVSRFIPHKTIGMLSFYGLALEQILKIERCDVTQQGITGYDIAFTNKDIDLLLQCKNLMITSNGRPLKGDNLIRTSSDKPIDVAYARKMFNAIEVNKDHKEFREQLMFDKIFIQGGYNRTYHYEAEHHIDIIYNSEGQTFFKKAIGKEDIVYGHNLKRYFDKYAEYKQHRGSVVETKVEPLDEVVAHKDINQNVNQETISELKVRIKLMRTQIDEMESILNNLIK